jgi:hypothetical protein
MAALMQTIIHRFPVRLTPFSIIGLLLLVVACGSITVDVRTDIRSNQEITEEFEYVIAGPIAELFITDGEIDLGDELNAAELEVIREAGWNLEMSVVQVDGADAVNLRLSQSIKGKDALEKFQAAADVLTEGGATGSMVPLLEITETEDEITYRASMSVALASSTAGTGATGSPDVTPTPDPLGQGMIDDDSFEDIMNATLQDFITLRRTVNMPGVISESNASSIDGGTLMWELDYADIASADGDLFATSVVNKNAGGNCNN